MIIFEDRSSYDPNKDSVTTIGLKIECNPGQKNSIMDSLGAVTRQAGVYSVEIDSMDASVSTVPEVPSTPPFLEESLVAVEPDSTEEVVAVVEPAVELIIEGEPDGEPILQPASSESEAVESIGDASTERTEEFRSTDEDGELGRSAWAEPEEGSVEQRT